MSDDESQWVEEMQPEIQSLIADLKAEKERLLEVELPAIVAKFDERMQAAMEEFRRRTLERRRRRAGEE